MLTRAPITSFSPADEPGNYRKSLGRFATGVTLVTVGTMDNAIGMVANSFASVSLDPALVLWCPAKQSSRHNAFVKAERFAINVLAEDQRELCNRFVRSAYAFDAFDFELRETAPPLLTNAVARFECETHTVHDAGDHSIIIGKVIRASEDRTKNPLVFADGDFCRLG